LRLYRFDALSLWLDEGFTVRFSRLPWPEVAGLRGEYDPHPPLYYTLVKAVALVVPDLQAGRLLSVVTGAATVALLSVLVARLMDPLAGLLSGLMLALSPLHYWYSQEARQYAPMTLAVAASYLGLVEYARRPTRRWAALYGGAALVAVYIDYSAVFALAPGGLILLWMVYRERRRAAPAVVAAGLAVLGLLPWLPQALASADREGAERAWYLGVSFERVQSVLLSVAGVHGRGLYYWGEPAPWGRWPDLRLLLLVPLALALGLGLLALARRSWLAVAVVAGLAGGTVVAAAGLSLLSPAFAERTVLPATLGWSAAIACAPFAFRHPAGRALGVVALLASLGLSLLTLDAVRDGDKQHWNALAADAGHVSEYGWPVITSPAVAETLIELYAPEAVRGEHLTIGGLGPLSPEALELANQSEALWLAHVESPESLHARDELIALGYEPVVVSRHRDRLLLELLVQPESLPGEAVDLNGRFAFVDSSPAGWNVRTEGGWIEPLAGGIALTREQDGESGISTATPAGEGLGILTFQARSELVSGRMRAFLICQDVDGGWTTISPDGAGAPAPNDGAWHSITIAALCPAGTSHARIDLRNGGLGTVAFRDVRLHWTNEKHSGDP
jgi:hypothetical protein